MWLWSSFQHLGLSVVGVSPGVFPLKSSLSCFSLNECCCKVTAVLSRPAACWAQSPASLSKDTQLLKQNSLICCHSLERRLDNEPCSVLAQPNLYLLIPFQTTRCWGQGLSGHTIVSMCLARVWLLGVQYKLSEGSVEKNELRGVDCNFPDYQMWLHRWTPSQAQPDTESARTVCVGVHPEP